MKSKTKNSQPKTTQTHQALIFSDTQVAYFNQVKKIRQVLQIETDLIVQGIIKDEQKLAAVLKPFLSKLPLIQGVTVCLPEHPVITKTISATSATQDLHEVVMWQVQKFMPYSLEKMIIDWQLVTPKDSKPRVLVAAVPAAFSESYYHLLQAPNVKLSDFDTPSLALSRLIHDKPHPAVAIGQVGRDLIMVGCLAPMQIKVTSLVNLDTESDQIKSNLKQMIDYLIQTAEVQVNGLYLSSEIETEFPLPDIDLKPEKLASGLEQSVADKSIFPALDPQTINLLPRAYSGSLHTSHSTPRAYWIATISLIWSIFSIFLFIPFIYLSWTRYVYISKQSLAPVKDNPQLKEFAQKVDLVNSVGAERTRLIQILGYLNQATPLGITINSLKAQSSINTITINGVAQTQAEVLDYKNQLEQDKNNIEAVKVPLSIYEKKSPMPFNLTIIYTKLNEN